tara:strand:+ start:1642 stop:2010 length:369 start_codon:yes stop_codon:yes gene_type:complete
MYNTNFLCTYKSISHELQEHLYRIQLLQVFDLSEWDDKIISSSMKEIYETLKDNLDIKDILKQLASSEEYQSYITIIGDNNEDIFCLLFNFDLFDLFHRCVCDIINNTKIDQNNKHNLLEKL